MRSSYGTWVNFQNRGAVKPTDKLGGARQRSIHQKFERQDRIYTGPVRHIDLGVEAFTPQHTNAHFDKRPWWKVKQY